MTFAASGLPSGLSIDSASGNISGTITYGASSSNPYSVTITATDSNANLSASGTINWNVSPLGMTLTDPGDLASMPGDVVSISLCAATSDGSAASFTASGLPTGLSIDSGTGAISGTIASDASDSSPYSVTVTATDGNASVSQTFAWTVSQIILGNPDDQWNVDGDAVSILLSAVTSDGLPATFSASGLPTGLSIDTETGVISGTIATDASGSSPYSVTVTATDGDASVSQTFTWTVSQIILCYPGDQWNVDGEAVNMPLTASAAQGDAISFTATGLPGGLSIDLSTGVISGTLADEADASGPYVVTVTATDVLTEASVSTDFMWSIEPAQNTAANIGQDGAIQYFPLGLLLVVNQVPVAAAPGMTWGQLFDVYVATPAGSVGNSVASVGQGLYGTGQLAASVVTGGNSWRNTMDAAYDRGPLGQTVDGPAWSYYGTRGALTVATAATAVVVVVEAVPVVVATGRTLLPAARGIVNQNTLNHIFGTARHNLGPLLNMFRGSQADAFQAVYRATAAAVSAGGVTLNAQGVFQTVVTVGNLNITVTGRVMDGVVRISNFWIP